MKTADLFAMAWSNLTRRKSRTILMVLGVAVGCCSIVIMISIGEGMRQSSQKMIESMGDLTTIQISNYQNPGMESPESGKTTKLDDAALESIQGLSHVKWATPVVDSSLPIEGVAGSSDRYTNSYLNVTAVKEEIMPELFKLKEGDYPKPATSEDILVVAGSPLEFQYGDSARPESPRYKEAYTMDGKEADPSDAWFDALHTPMGLRVSLNDENSKLEKRLKVTGRVESNHEFYASTSGVIMSLTDFNVLKAEVDSRNGEVIAGSRTRKSTSYDQVMVKVDELKNVADVEEAIHQLGFTQTSSSESMRKSMEESMMSVQLTLGGIGAVSLLVAAISITNTMMMSITERTREIGIMKALGCPVGNIRSIFMDETGLIGLLGGISGIVFSCLVSWGLNVVAQNAAPTEMMLSYIPPWLALFGLLFSIVVALLAGWNPARKAVKIPAIEAIRNG